MKNNHNIYKNWRGVYILLTYIAVLLSMIPLAKQMSVNNALTIVFAVTAYAVHAFLYILPVVVLIFLSSWFLSWVGRWKDIVVSMVAVTSATTIHVLLYLDHQVFRLYNYHLDNSFVLNLVTTPGGMDSMEMSAQTMVTLGKMVGLFVLLQLFLLGVSFVLVRRYKFALKPWVVKITMGALGVAALFQSLAYAFSSFWAYWPIVSVAGKLPFYTGLTMKGMLENLGYTQAQQVDAAANPESTPLQYPLVPLTIKAERKLYNIVFLVAESWRWDMLAPDITPATWAFSKEALRFDNHYSAGHDTRSAIFGLFYGLPSPYWFSFHDARRSPVLMDQILQDGYQTFIHTSAAFTSPEFNQTVFAKIPSEQLHEASFTCEKWEEDRKHVSAIMESIDTRDKQKPFFVYMFFESPHARYFFPEECAIRKPYEEELDYLKMDLKNHIHLIKNRYINACNHLDTQLDRMIRYLREKNLLDSTIVVITGDHGEEFMEKGRWGHGVDYHQEAIRTPMILWVPGMTPRVHTKMTSHLDIPATLLPFLGVTNPAEDYSLGISLLGQLERTSTLVGGWNDIAYIDEQMKIVVPMGGARRFQKEQATTLDDKPIESSSNLYDTHKHVFVNMLKDLSRFRKKEEHS